MKKIEICFLGAAKRNVLIEQFIKAGKRLGLQIKVYSVEADEKRFYPISNIATIIAGPNFYETDEFFSLARSKLTSFDLVIPMMDSACLALARSVESGLLTHSNVLVSHAAFVENTVNKKKFSCHLDFGQLPHIPNTQGLFPKIAKPIFGFGGRGLIDIMTDADASKIDPFEYIIQDRIFGSEVTLDAFFDREGKFIQGIARERLEVIAGEVNHLFTRELTSIELGYLYDLGKLGARGPINMQLIGPSSNQKVLEINPRFGGGVTASIEAGADFAEMSLRNWLMNEKIEEMIVQHIEMVRSRADYYRILE